MSPTARKSIRAAALTAVMACAWLAATYTQNRLTAARPALWSAERMSFLPKTALISRFTFGFTTTYSSYLWIRTVLYFGDHFLTDKEYPWLVRMVDVITKINPGFYPPYEFAGLLLPDLCGAPGASRVILERGLSHFGPRQWKIPFHLGMIQYQWYNDNRSAADYFALAARMPGAQSHKLAALAATFYTRAGATETGIELLRFMYQTSEDPAVKKHLEEKINTQVEQLRQNTYF